MTPSIAPQSAPQTANDVAAYDEASYVRRPVVVPAQESPTPPSEPAARRRFIAQRGW
ncbi:hypothetical protein PV334_19985 [Streptomyces sp. ME02-7008A-1]|uniref:hypothetical protein n=1 Tax=unclassified Streptomyces TaxID=2593676 RepID=UPI0029BF4A3C|nr:MULTISPECIES: hypothetical protein [unclassified Streptomyces]MDX3183529.1 hypothetical protein [Streptomyces sp. ME02-7008A-1]MDX3303981.1 hypothetical protein [Streptomyces sp. ME02-7008A]